LKQQNKTNKATLHFLNQARGARLRPCKGVDDDLG